jgi:hypothetical protein
MSGTDVGSLFERDVNSYFESNGPQNGDDGQQRSELKAGESLGKNESGLPTSLPIAVVPWKKIVGMDKGSGLRPFLVTTANLDSAVSAADWAPRRIEAEELWLVKATDREDAISRVSDFLKPKIACVDAFDTAVLRALARAAEGLRSVDEDAAIMIATPWCAEVAFAQ